MKKRYQIPNHPNGKRDLNKVGHDIKSAVIAVDSAYKGMEEHPENSKDHDVLYELAKERLLSIASALRSLDSADENLARC